LIPLRIAHHPGVVLEVLVATNTTRHYSSRAEVLEATSSCLGAQCLEHLIALSASLRDTTTAHQPVTSLPQCTETLRTDQYCHEDPPSLQSETEGNMDQQDQLGELKQQTEQMQHQIEEILQRTASMQQQMVEIVQKTEDTASRNRQQLRQQMDNMTQKLQHLQEWADEADRGNPLTMDQIRGEFSRRQLEILNRHIIMHERIQAVLRDSTKEPAAPRLFFILPKDIDQQDHSADEPSSRLFRLHFLCEFGSHTMSKDSKDPHEVHMTDHPGYDLKRPKEFIDKYGSHVMTMMHMVKHGAMAAGLVVPPLLQSKHTGLAEQSQGLSKENISRLIDETIAHLESMTLPGDSGTDIEGSRDLSDVKSYLEIDGDDHFPGDIHQLTILEQHCSWVCKEHRYEWTLQHLKDIVNTVGGTHVENPGNIDIKVNSDDVTKQLYDVVTEICTIQCTKDKLPLSMDCGRLSLITGGSRDVQDVVVTVKRLSDLTTDDIEFIRQLNLTKLSIELTPATTDEDTLVSILRQSGNLKELRIGCIGTRSRAIINLVVSTREMALQDGRSTALQTFELMDEGMKPFQFDRSWDALDHVFATLTFSEDSTKLDVDTHLVLQNSMVVAEDNWICNFIRQYGWSISRLNTAPKFNDYLATILDDATQIHGSKLTHLVLSQRALTTVGMDSMDRVIKRSRGLTFFKASLVGLQMESQPEKVAAFLERFGARLNTLEVVGDEVERWLPGLLRNFPPKSSLPILDFFILGSYDRHAFPHECIPWLLVPIVSDPLQPSGPTPQNTGKPSTIPTRLKRFWLSKFTLTLEDWAALIKAIDLSVMLELKFTGTNFSQEQLDLLLDCIAGAGEQSVALEGLDFRNSDLVGNTDKDALRGRIHKVAPRVIIQGL
ncbi:hypothetical protein BGX31_002078, partial [Mortierella sp. GBA43]